MACYENRLFDWRKSFDEHYSDKGWLMRPGMTRMNVVSYNNDK